MCNSQLDGGIEKTENFLNKHSLMCDMSCVRASMRCCNKKKSTRIKIMQFAH